MKKQLILIISLGIILLSTIGFLIPKPRALSSNVVDVATFNFEIDNLKNNDIKLDNKVSSITKQIEDIIGKQKELEDRLAKVENRPTTTIIEKVVEVPKKEEIKVNAYYEEGKNLLLANGWEESQTQSVPNQKQFFHKNRNIADKPIFFNFTNNSWFLFASKFRDISHLKQYLETRTF